MEFRVLGRLDVISSGQAMALGRPSEQMLLAVLLIDADHVVALSRLVDALWEDRPPATAPKQVRNAVGRLRHRFAASGSTNVVITDHSGYRISVAEHSLDALRFNAAVTGANRAAAAGRSAVAASLLKGALDQWRGPFLTGMRGRAIDAAAAAWEEQRNSARHSYYELMLALGRHRQIVAELLRLAADHPLHEDFAAHLMLALYRCGRRAEALSVYRRTQATLAAELALDPGRSLRYLHQQILTCDPALSPGQFAPIHPGRASCLPGQSNRMACRSPFRQQRCLPW